MIDEAGLPINDPDVNSDIESIFPDQQKVPFIRPEMREGTQIIISNKEHPLYFEQGVVVERDHRYYRIKFVSQNKHINDLCLWIPEHWVEPLPKELKGLS